MKRLAATFVVLITVLMLPAISRAENHQLTDEYMDTIHARGLMVFIDFNMFLADFGMTSSPTITGDDMLGLSDIPDSLNNIHIGAQEVGDNNTGNVLQSSVQLNGNAQQNLNSFVNINAASSVVPFGINITVIQGDNYGTVSQRNLSLGMFRSTLFMLGGI